MNEPKIKTAKSDSNEAGIAIGKSLKAHRHASDKTQEDLGFEAAVDRTYVSQIERGVGNPSILTLANLCYALGITLADLFAPVKVSVKPDEQTRRKNQAKLKTAAPRKPRLR